MNRMLIGLLAMTFASATACSVTAESEATSDASAANAGPTTFTVRVENVSTQGSLVLSSGDTAPAPTAPVLWAVATGSAPLFSTGAADRGLGLESLAEDGDPSKLAMSLENAGGIVAVGAMAVPVGDAEAGPITPGKAYEFDVTVEPGQRLHLAMMFGQSNDLFYAPRESGIDLFADGAAVSGDVTPWLMLWDAGTEVNEEPGAGADQAPRQPAPNTGQAEGGVVRPVDDQFSYPPVDEVIKITVTPHDGSTTSE